MLAITLILRIVPKGTTIKIITRDNAPQKEGFQFLETEKFKKC